MQMSTIEFDFEILGVKRMYVSQIRSCKGRLNRPGPKLR